MRLSRWVITVSTALSAALLVALPAATFASRPAHTSASGGKTATVTTGNDISWPQCNKLNRLPTGHAFGIVGVNGGRANTSNPCMSQEITWANQSTGKTAQPKTAFYVNTGNPGDVTPAVGDWPTSNRDIVNPTVTDSNPYGTCAGANDAACAWQYGYNMANADAALRQVPTPATYHWYLDVETSNSWSTNTANNAADLEGMVAYFKSIGVAPGLYSTSYQWGIIVGSYGTTMDAGGNSLNGLDSWLPGASSQASAQTLCKQPPLTAGGRVTLTQYVSGQFDYDVSCS